MADSMIKDLTAGTPSANDVIPYIADPTGTPLDRITTLTNLLSSVAGAPATSITETGGPADLDIAAIADGKFLKRSGTDIVGADETGLLAQTAWAAKGDLVVGTGNDTAAILTAGTNGYILRYDSGETTGLKAVPDEIGLQFIVGNGTDAIAAGFAGFMEVPTNFTLQSVTLVADASGSIVVDIWKNTYANFPPTDADSITAAAPPTLSSAQKNTDSTLTSWTTDWNKGDWLGFNVDSATTVKQVTISFKGVRR